MKILVCDIGNSAIKFGLFSEGELQTYHQISHDDFSYATLSKLRFDNVAISSVVPEVTLRLKELLETQYNLSPLVLKPDSGFSLNIKYESPRSLGIDRLCGSEGAFYFYQLETGKNTLDENELLLTIDCGTATTINLVNSPCNFVGGVISPGLYTMIDSLTKRTAQLPVIDFGKYRDVIGKNTEECIASGILNSTIGLIEKVIDELTENSLKIIHLYLTGGNSGIIAPYLKINFTEKPDLVLYGIYSVASKYFEKKNL